MIKKRYLRPKNWHCVRYSDEVHFRYSLQGKLYIICKLVEQYYPDCIKEDKESNKKDKKHHQCWAVVGYNLKLDIHFYEIPGNINGKMSQKIYIDQIFQPFIKPWIEAYYNFVLKENGNLSHGPGKSNIICTWKETNSLEFYFNYYSLSDLALIENCQQPGKQYLYKYLH